MSPIIRFRLALAWLAWLALPWLGLACLSAWLVIVVIVNSKNNNGGAKRRPPAEGGRVVVIVDNDKLGWKSEL